MGSIYSGTRISDIQSTAIQNGVWPYILPLELLKCSENRRGVVGSTTVGRRVVHPPPLRNLHLGPEILDFGAIWSDFERFSECLCFRIGGNVIYERLVDRSVFRDFFLNDDEF